MPITLAQLVRIIKAGGGVAVGPPDNEALPVLTATTNLEVGSSVVCTSGGWDGEVTVVGYRFKNSLGEYVTTLLSNNNYILQEADEGLNISCEVTVQNVGGSVTVTSNAVGPVVAGVVIPPAGDMYAGLNAASLAKRAQMVAEWDGVWSGVPAEIDDIDDYDSDVLVSDTNAAEAQFAIAQRALPLSGWHRIRLDSSQPASAWSTTGDFRAASSGAPDNHSWTIGHYYGSPTDRSSAGGGIVIESSDRNNPVLVTETWTFRGVRGLHIRYANFAKTATDTASNDACQMLVFTASTTNRDGYVVRVSDCEIGTLVNPAVTDGELSGKAITCTGFGEQIDVIDNIFNGTQCGTSITCVRYYRRWRNHYINTLGDNSILSHTGDTHPTHKGVRKVNENWDERILYWSRGNTSPYLYDTPGSSGEHTDACQVGQTADCGGYTILREFDVHNMQRTTGTDARYITWGVNQTAGQTLTVAGVVFTFVTTESLPTHIGIQSTLSLTLDRAKAVVTAYGFAGLQRISKTSTRLEFHWYFGQYQVATASAPVVSVSSPLRLNGGPQNQYTDDTPAAFLIDQLTHNCIGTSGIGIVHRAYQGTNIIDRCIYGRPPQTCENASTLRVPSDGFNYSHDWAPYCTSTRKDAAPTGAFMDHKVINSILGQLNVGTNDEILTTNTTSLADDCTVVTQGNVFVDWRNDAAPGTSPDDLLNATFTRTAIGNKYQYELDVLGTPQQFREAMYAKLKLANATDALTIGTTDPATWVL